jgi:hypothetical protein
VDPVESIKKSELKLIDYRLPMKKVTYKISRVIKYNASYPLSRFPRGERPDVLN